MDDKTWLKIAAIGGVVVLEAVALFLGYNGTGLALAVGVVSGLGGYFVAKEGK